MNKTTRKTMEQFNKRTMDTKRICENTVVKEDAIYLFNNKIAWHNQDNIRFNMCGYNTRTTRERLLAAGVEIKTFRGNAYYTGFKGVPVYDSPIRKDFKRISTVDSYEIDIRDGSIKTLPEWAWAREQII